jgi:hypothetical protein
MTAPMKRPLLALVIAVFAFSLGGCIVHTHSKKRGASRVSCHPSQYWDGHQCRHKGKGHGARKHDGR